MPKKLNRLKGIFGENTSVKYLRKKGYKILETNFTCKMGEVDIIAKHKDTLVFVEVKSRKDGKYGYPSEAVNYHKQKKISKVALYYLQKNDLFHYNVRFDVIEILNVDSKDVNINHILNAFEIIM